MSAVTRTPSVTMALQCQADHSPRERNVVQQPFGGFPPHQQYAFPNQPPARGKDSGLATAALIFSLFGLIGLVS